MQREKTNALRSALTWLRNGAPEILSQLPTWVKGVKRIAEIAMLAQYLLDDDLGRLDPTFAEDAQGWLKACWRVLRRGEFLADCVESDPV